MKVLATATFDDSYGGPLPVRLVIRGKAATWEGVDCYVTCGYRPVPAARAIANARRDARFSNVQEA